MDRRAFLRGLGKSAVAARLATLPRIDAPAQTLGGLAEGKGFLFGSEALQRELSGDPAYARLIAEQSRILVAGNELKWDAVRPTREQFNFGPGNWMLEFAKAHKLLFRGHNLAWHEAVPRWLPKTVNGQNAKDLLVEHIRTVVTHYAGLVHSWDVVNEIIGPEDKRPDGMKKSLWLDWIGPEFVEIAFQTARDADSKALLVWNENWLETDADYSRKKRQHTLDFLKQLKKRNVPVQALGLQGHVFADQKIAPELPAFLEQVADMGLMLLITELDVRDRNLRADIADRDRLVAARYYELLSAVLENKAVIAVLTWGLTDRYTWINKSNSRRPDGLPSRALPYDADLHPTAAWTAMEKAFAEAPSR